MFLGEFIFAFCIALIFLLLSTLVLKRTWLWSPWWTFFVVFLAAWAGSLWITPIGPLLFGIYWLPMIYVAFIFIVLLAAVSRPGSQRTKVETISQVKQEEAAVEKVLNAFFWLLLISLIIVIILGYFKKINDF